MSDENINNAGSNNVRPSFRYLPNELELFRGTGFELIPLNGKAPVAKGWRNQKPLSVDAAIERLERGIGNVGIRLRTSDLVLDFDPRNYDGVDRLEQLQKDLGIDLYAYPHVVTGTGGHHFYMSVDVDADFLGKVPNYPGVDVKKAGGFLVAPGSAHPDTGKPYSVDPLADQFNSVPPAPASLIDKITRSVANDGADSGCISCEQLEGILEGVDVELFGDYDEWLRFAMACHHATNGSSREVFLDWSATDPTYAGHEEENGRKWDGFSDSGGVTAGTLVKLLREKGYEDKASLASALIDFHDSDDFDLPAAANRISKKAGVSASTRTGIADEFVWVARPKGFFNRHTGGKLDPVQFTSLYQQAWPDSNIVNAVFKGRLPMRKFEHLVYEPGLPEFIDGEAGGADSRYNIWRSTGCDAVEGDWPVIKKHVEYLWPNDPVQQGYFYDFLSFVVRDEFVKTHFAMLIRGAQGIGKSFFGKLAGQMLGKRNVVLPSNDEVTSRWTAWTEGAQLAVIEELMTRGRVDMANRLKPIITQEDLRIEDKGFPLYTIPNRLNLIAFTNHADALPIEKTDRRWLILFSEPDPFDDEVKSRDYYKQLFAAIETEGPAFKQYLQTRQVGLDPKGHAPSTVGKEEMRRLSLGEIEQTLDEMLQTKQSPFDFDLVRLEDLLGVMPKERNVRPRTIKWLKDEAGAVEHARYTKVDSSGRKAWTLWSVRNHSKWRDAGAAARYDAYIKHGTTI